MIWVSFIVSPHMALDIATAKYFTTLKAEPHFSLSLTDFAGISLLDSHRNQIPQRNDVLRFAMRAISNGLHSTRLIIGLPVGH